MIKDNPWITFSIRLQIDLLILNSKKILKVDFVWIKQLSPMVWEFVWYFLQTLFPFNKFCQVLFHQLIVILNQAKELKLKIEKGNIAYLTNNAKLSQNQHIKSI